VCDGSGVTPLEFPIATDALTVVANPGADWVDCLTVEQLQEIWQADGAQRWSDIDEEWPDEEFELYGAATTSGTFDYFNEAILGEELNHRSDYYATERDRTIVQGVQGSEAALGYFGFSYYSENPDSIKAISIDDGDGCVEPSIETAMNEEYTPFRDRCSSTSRRNRSPNPRCVTSRASTWNVPRRIWSPMSATSPSPKRSATRTSRNSRPRSLR